MKYVLIELIICHEIFFSYKNAIFNSFFISRCICEIFTSVGGD